MSIETGRISVVIPTCNRAQLVGQAIESVFNQSYPNVEAIVVDDGSTGNILIPFVNNNSY